MGYLFSFTSTQVSLDCLNLSTLNNFFKRALISTNLSIDKAIHCRIDGKPHVLL